MSEPSDPHLACVEAQALVEADIGREADARRLLEGAIERASARFARGVTLGVMLAFALARLDDQEAQYRAYSKVIELTWDPEVRALAFSNRGDVAMLERDLAGARSDYEQAILGGGDPEIVALARYGLAVAEERLGDLPAAYAALDKALVVKLPVPPFPSEDPLRSPERLFRPAVRGKLHSRPSRDGRRPPRDRSGRTPRRLRNRGRRVGHVPRAFRRNRTVPRKCPCSPRALRARARESDDGWNGARPRVLPSPSGRPKIPEPNDPRRRDFF